MVAIRGTRAALCLWIQCFFLLVATAAAWTTVPDSTRRSLSSGAASISPVRFRQSTKLSLTGDSSSEETLSDSVTAAFGFAQVGGPLSRRGWAQSLVISATVAAVAATSTPVLAAEDLSSTKVLVLGGTGFVGSRVVQSLRGLGVQIVATSRDGRDGTVALDFTAADKTKDAVQKLSEGCTAVISCIGSIGTPNDEVINSGTSLAAAGAKAAGVQRFVYITVAPEVREFAKGIDFLEGYMKGKQVSRDAVLSNFGDKGILIEPTFIYGGGSFEVNPPRVPDFYGKFVDGILSSSPIRSIDRVLSPGFIKIALEPPVNVDAVAGAAVAGALGKSSPVLDSYDKIKEAAALI